MYGQCHPFLRSSVLLSCPQKQKKPAAAPNVGAILGEAADVVVGKYANSGGHASSPYLNRLSEIQIQDEAHIYQQLVKPEEGARGCQQATLVALLTYVKGLVRECWNAQICV